MLSLENTLLIVIDVQGKLARVVAESESANQAVRQLVQGAGCSNTGAPDSAGSRKNWKHHP